LSENKSPLNRLPDSARTVLIYANPTAGTGQRGAALEELAGELKWRGHQTERIDSFSELTQAVAELHGGQQLRAIVSAGGDGTAAEIANRTPPKTPLAIFPLGTANLLANYLGLTRDPVVLAEIIASGHTAVLDAGRANGRLFLLMAGVGFDAEVVRRLHTARSGNISGWAYAKPIWQSLRNYRYPELRVYCARAGAEEDSEAVAGGKLSAGDHAAADTTAAGGNIVGGDGKSRPWEDPIICRWAFVFNISRYAAGLNFAPAASGCDGQLDLCTFQRGGLLSGLKYLAAVVRERHGNLSDCTGQRGVQFRIEADEAVPYELDGDPGGTLPLTIDIVPRRLCWLVSAGWSAANAGVSK
jgi:diacylglycerol kinase (ATP)